MTFNRPPLEIQINGGLGNQLFGLAAGVTVSNFFSRKPLFNLERVRFGSNLSRVPDLQNIDLSLLGTETEYLNFDYPSMRLFYEKIRRSSRHKLPPLTRHRDPEYLDSRESPREQLRNIQNDVESIGGPFMDFEWAEMAKDYGFPLHIWPKSPSKNFHEFSNFVSGSEIAIHIRLGDYLKHPDIFPIVPESYYLSALEYVNFRKGETVHVFTDSPKLVRENFVKLLKISGVKIIDPTRKMSALETMSLMSRYPKLITSNSTFSSWAGWFSPGKRVVTPVPYQYKDWRDTLPNHWTRIDIA